MMYKNEHKNINFDDKKSGKALFIRAKQQILLKTLTLIIY